MKCPHCDFSGHRMDLHAHLVDRHPEGVLIYVDETRGKMVFEMACPLCGEKAVETLKKRAAMLEEYHREIRMVAFDLLLYHLQGKHEG